MDKISVSATGILLTCVFIFGYILSYSVPSFQTTEVDSSKNTANFALEDSSTVNKLISLSYQYYCTGRYKEAFDTGKQANVLSKKITYNEGIAKSYISMGNSYFGKGEYLNSEKYYLLAFKFIKDIKSTSSLITLDILANCYSNLGGVYFHLGDYPKSINQYLNALAIEDKYHLNSGDSETLNNIANAYRELGNYNKAIEYIEQAIRINTVSDNKYILSSNYINLASIYFETERTELALKYYNKAYILKKEINDPAGVATSLMNIGVVYQEQGKYNETYFYYKEALKIAEQCGDNNTISSCYSNLGRYYEIVNKNNEAISYTLKSLKINTQIGNRNHIINNYYNLTWYYTKVNNSQKAIEYLKLYTSLSDSIYNEKSSKLIAEMQERYESEKQEKVNELLVQKNLILTEKNNFQQFKIHQSRIYIAFLILFIIMLVLAGYLIFRHKHTKAIHKQLEMKQKLLLSQMNPHFIYNAMVGVQNAIYKNSPHIAADYLSAIAHLTRSIIEDSQKEYIDLESELTSLNYYLSLHRLRYQNKFKYTFEIAPEVDTKEIFIPPMLVQPFVENAIVHGVLKNTIEGIITIKCNLLNDCICIEIIDNGIGRKKSGEVRNNSDEHLSIATNITKERIEILKKKVNAKFSFSIIDLYNNSHPCGTKVIFLFPIVKDINSLAPKSYIQYA